MFTKTMNELTTFRRKVIKNDLVESYESPMDDEKNPANPLWLAGNNVHAAIRKEKDNAFLAERLWPGLQLGRTTTENDPSRLNKV